MHARRHTAGHHQQPVDKLWFSRTLDAAASRYMSIITGRAVLSCSPSCQLGLTCRGVRVSGYQHWQCHICHSPILNEEDCLHWNALYSLLVDWWEGSLTFPPALDLLPLFMYYELCNGQDCIIRCKLLWPSHLRWLYGPQVSQGRRPLYGGISSRSHVFTISTLFNKHGSIVQ